MTAVKMDVNVSDFVRDIQEVKRESGRSTEEMLKYTMILMLQAGRNATRLGKKNRSLQTQSTLGAMADFYNGDESAEENAGLQYFEVYSQGNPIPKKVFLPRIPRKSKKNEAARAEALRAKKAIMDRFKEIRRRGLAKASWGWAMALLNKRNNAAEVGREAFEGMRGSPVYAVEKYGGTHAFLEVVNKLGWIRKIAPGIEQRMINSADARLNAWLDRRWQTGLDHAARRRA